MRLAGPPLLVSHLYLLSFYSLTDISGRSPGPADSCTSSRAVSCKFPFFVDVLANYITISLLTGIEVPDDKYDSPANGRTSRHPSAPTSEFESPEDSDVVMETDGNGKTGRSFPNDPDFRNKALMSVSVRTRDDMNADGFFNDVDIQAIDEPNKRREDKPVTSPPSSVLRT